jgi:hypothetical protein
MVPIDARGAQLNTEGYSRMVLRTDTPLNRTFHPTARSSRPLRARSAVKNAYM